MTREEAKVFYPIMKAFAEGKVIETRTDPSTLKGKDTPNGWVEMKEIEYWANIQYRIKPEPKYRPFKDANECWQEMLKHQPFGWVKTEEGYEQIFHVNEGDDFNLTFKYCTFADGTPFGVKVEE